MFARGRSTVGEVFVAFDAKVSRFANDERHRAAARQTMSWAVEAAEHGNRANALAWLAVLDAIRHEFSDEELDQREMVMAQLSDRSAMERSC